MYTRLLRKSVHTKKFTVVHNRESGWEISEEEDNRVILSIRYKDWHRVEHAMQTFAKKAASLRKHGWADYSLSPSVVHG
jgi:hypothetical protein